MTRNTGHREIAFALLVSTLLHVLGIVVIQRYYLPPKVEQGIRVSFSVPGVQRRFLQTQPPAPMYQDQTQPSISLSQELLERLLAGTGVPALEPGGRDLPEIEEPNLREWQFKEGSRELPEKEGWQTPGDTAEKGLLPSPLLHEPTEHLPWALDLVELDAYRRQRTIAIVDPKTRKLSSAQLHLPAYMNALDHGSGCPPYQRGQEIVEVLDLLGRGFQVPRPTPIASQIHWFRLGPCGGLSQPVQARCCNDDDPIHTFSNHPGRHILAYEEMKEYSVLSLQLIDIESTEAMVRYLMEGGFALVKGQQLSLLQEKLKIRVGARLKLVTIELGHPLFHSFYDITKYVDPTPPPTNCPPIEPLPGLELDGRLIVVVGPRFNRKYPCQANKFYVNVLAYALIQPSPMGGRYLSGHPN